MLPAWLAPHTATCSLPHTQSCSPSPPRWHPVPGNWKTGSCRDGLTQPLRLPELDLLAIQEKNPVFCLNFYRRLSLTGE